MRRLVVAAVLTLFAACGGTTSEETPDAGGTTPDAGSTPDAGVETPDGGDTTPDAGEETPDGGDEPDGGEVTYAGRGGACTRSADCGQNRFQWICASGICERICQNDNDCSEYDGLVCADAVCQEPRCSVDDDCEGDDVCHDGSCVAPTTTVARCEVLPSALLLVGTESAQVEVRAFDASNVPVAVRAATWSASNGSATVTGNTQAANVAGATAGMNEIRATIGTKACTPASARVVALAGSSKVLVVVVDEGTNAPISGASVVIGVEHKTTNADGVAEFDRDGTTRTVSVWKSGRSTVTFDRTSETTLRARLRPTTRTTWTSSFAISDFARVLDLQGTARGALVGSSVRHDPTTIVADSLVGRSAETTLDLGSQTAHIFLSDGVVFGLAGETLSKSDVTVRSNGVGRYLWSIAANAQFSALTQFMAPIFSGSSERAFGGWPLFPGAMFGSAAHVAAIDQPAAGNVDITFGGPAGATLQVAVPNVPVDGSPVFDSVVALALADDRGNGALPLGFVAGIDLDGMGAVRSMGPSESGLSLRVGAAPAGLTASKRSYLAVAFSSARANEAGDLPDESSPIVRLGLATTAAPESGVVSFGREFPAVPGDVILVDRTVYTEDLASEIGLVRIEVGDWEIFTTPTAGEVEVDLPLPPDGITDPLAGDAPILFHGYVGSTLSTVSRKGFDASGWNDLEAWITTEVVR